MSILIKGMEMPKEQNVPTWAVIFSNGEVRIYKDGFNTDQGNGKGTAIPVPPHGRLIDADDFCTEHRSLALLWKVGLRRFNWHIAAAAFVDDAPTIIPAELLNEEANE